MGKTACCVIIALLLLMNLLFFSSTRAEERGNDSPGELPVKGMVTMLELGHSLCLSCQRMETVVKEVRQQYQGKAAIVSIDLVKFPEQAKKYELRTVPTQIFFDKDGVEQIRHEGYLSTDRCIKNLKKLGMK